MIFADGKFCKEVLYDPHYLFHGEEINLTVRAFTHGYDLFHPHKPVVYHEYSQDLIGQENAGTTIPLGAHKTLSLT